VRVIDSSTLVKYFSHEAGWEKAREIILEGALTLDNRKPRPLWRGGGQSHACRC